MAENTYRAEIGAWVESTTPKANGKGMRKVWVSPAPKGESTRLSVIATRDARETHVLTLHVDTPEQRTEAHAVLALALASMPAEAPKAPKAAPKPPTPPKAPAAVTRNPAPVKPPLASLPKPAPATGRVTSTKLAPDAGVSWFTSLMHEAGAI